MSDQDLEDLRAAAEAWMAEDPDPSTRAEVARLLATDDAEGLQERFGERLQFGTAGLRGILGAGPNRMNRALVRRAAAGLAQFLIDRRTTSGGVAIGYDARHLSLEFAWDSARVLAGAGIRALLLPRPSPTPLLAYAVRDLGADGGVMVTASHNPPQYNGYKVYLGDGAQIIPPVDHQISERIGAVGSLAGVAMAPTDDPLITLLGEGVLEHYLTSALGLSLTPAARDVSIAYTPMHGVGGSVATQLLASAGFSDVAVVKEQFDPDPDFSTVAFPNPEEKGAMDRVLALAAAEHADVALANDPDADRLGVAVPLAGGGWRRLSGDETGVLLADHVVRHTAGEDRLVVTSIVSSTMLSRMAAAAGVHFLVTLTGFKWLARSVDIHPGWRFMFGYEEALGYCVGSMVRDKDGLTAAMVFAELVAGLRADGQSVQDRLDELARAYGAHVTKQWSVTLPGPGGPARIEAVVEGLRAAPPAALAGHPVTDFVDLAAGGRGLPPTEGVILFVGERRRVIVRPSGTEPKVKVYFEAVEEVDHEAGKGAVEAARARGARTVDELQQAMSELTGLPI